MDKNGHISIQVEALGGFRLQIKIPWYPPTLWLDLEGARGIETIQHTLEIKNEPPSKFWDEE